MVRYTRPTHISSSVIHIVVVNVVAVVPVVIAVDSAPGMEAAAVAAATAALAFSVHCVNVILGGSLFLATFAGVAFTVSGSCLSSNEPLALDPVPVIGPSHSSLPLALVSSVHHSLIRGVAP